jgi:hypothetical protein
MTFELCVRFRSLGVVAWLCGFTVTAAACQVQPPSPARDLLIDVNEADWEELAADPSLNPRQPALVKILRRLAQLDYGLLERRAERLDELPTEPAAAGRLLAVAGEVREVRVMDRVDDEKIKGEVADQARESGVAGYFLRVATSTGDCWLACREIPTAWGGTAPHENTRISCPAYFLKRVTEGGQSLPLFAGRRLAWHPQTAGEGISFGRTVLGRAGVDVGQLEWVEGRGGEPLNHEETLCLLTILSRAGAALSPGLELSSWDLPRLLQAPRGRAGDIGRLEGVVQRITRVDLDDHPHARWLGLDEYYQLDLTVDLGNLRINILDPSKSAPLAFEGDFPVTLLVRRLPAGWGADDKPGLPVTVPAFYFRMWSFSSALSRRADAAARQPAPLFIGGVVQPLDVAARPFERGMTWIVAGAMAGLAAFAAGLWWLDRRGRRRRRKSVVLVIGDLDLP